MLDADTLTRDQLIVHIDELTSQLQAQQPASLMRYTQPWFEALFQNMLDEVHVWRVLRDDAGRIANWRLVDLNPAAEASWGLTRDELIGKTTDEIFSPSALATFKPIVEEAFHRNCAYTWEEYFPDLDQHLHMTTVPMGEHFISTGADVTSLRKAQEAAARASTVELEASQAIKDTLQKTVDALAYVVEARDPYTAGHEARVAKLAVSIGKAMGFDADRLQGLELAATIHDLGKVVVPADILAKPTTLTRAEYDIVKEHPLTGAGFIQHIDFDWPIATIVAQHHERWDGTGYPHQLSGEDILLEARIIGVADTVEAMAHHRPYREGLGLEAAMDEIREGAGSKYDPDVVAACLRCLNPENPMLPI